LNGHHQGMSISVIAFPRFERIVQVAMVVAARTQTSFAMAQISTPSFVRAGRCSQQPFYIPYLPSTASNCGNLPMTAAINAWL
jgi:hypothetical protein